MLSEKIHTRSASETKDYAITIDASGNILKMSDGITLSAGVSIDVN